MKSGRIKYIKASEMSLYIICPTCNRLLGDKELIVEKMRDEGKSNEEIVKALEIPDECYCCKARVLTFVDLTKIIK